MTTSSEQEPLQAQAPDAEGASGAGNLDKVRDLIFGGQMRTTTASLPGSRNAGERDRRPPRRTEKTVAGLEAYMKTEVESLSERLRVEQDGRTSADKDLGRELRDAGQQLDQNLAARRFRCARSARSPAAARAAPGARGRHPQPGRRRPGPPRA